jgi:phosphatidylserine synthase
MNWTMFVWGLVAFLIIALPTITGLARVNAGLRFLLESKDGKFSPLRAIKPGGVAYALTFSFKISFLTALILDYVEYVKQTYLVVSLFIFLIMLDLVVQFSGPQFTALSLNLKSAFAGATVVALVLFALNFSVQRKLKKLLPAEAENYRKNRKSPALRMFDQRG